MSLSRSIISTKVILYITFENLQLKQEAIENKEQKI